MAGGERGMAGTLEAYVRLARPYQWVKNGFVFAGVLFGHALGNPLLLGQAVTLFAAFCCMASAVYSLNDVADRTADRAHPRKRERPIASGRVGVVGAVIFAALLALAGLSMAAQVSMTALLIVTAYAVINAAYSAGLKHVAVLDVFIIASGFMLRLLAGTMGLEIAPSRWLLLCGFMATLFLGFAKRRAEIGGDAGADPASARRALDSYTPALLDRMIGICAAGALIAYGLYTIDPMTVAIHGTDRLIFTLPLVAYGLLRYLFVLYRRGGGGDPTLEFLRDPHLIGAVVVWLVTTVALIA